MMNNTERYLSLLKKSILNELYVDNEARIFFLVDFLFSNSFIKSDLPRDGLINIFLNIERTPYFQNVQAVKAVGGMIAINHRAELVASAIPLANYFLQSHSMIGRARLDSLHACLEIIFKENIPGDFIETGVWRGGVPIFIKGFLAAHGIADRKIWLADSFEGLPKPERVHEVDLDYSKQAFPSLAVSLEEVRSLFERYHLYDENVMFLKGWFKDTLPNTSIERLALLRLDGDLYESTMDALVNLYDKVSDGGFVIVDDYHSFPGCKDAVDEFRGRFGIQDELIKVDYAAVFWRKSGLKQ